MVTTPMKTWAAPSWNTFGKSPESVESGMIAAVNGYVGPLFLGLGTLGEAGLAPQRCF